MNRPPMLTWEDLTVGDRLRPFEFEVAEDTVVALRSAIADEGGRADLAPAGLLTFPMLNAIDATWSQRPGTVHARQRFALHAPIPVGTHLRVEGQLTRMELRRGRRYLLIGIEVHDGEGAVVASGEATVLYPEEVPT